MHENNTYLGEITVKIGIVGVGLIGKTLTQRLSAAGHEVKVANSRGPETIDVEVLSAGGQAVEAADAVVDVDVVILSIPLNRIPDVAPLFTDVPAETVVDRHLELLSGARQHESRPSKTARSKAFG